VHLRDRVGIEHPLRADVGCRNTLFNARAQTGAEYFQELRDSGLTHYRVELLEENKSETEAIVRAYRALLTSPSMERICGAGSRLSHSSGSHAERSIVLLVDTPAPLVLIIILGKALAGSAPWPVHRGLNKLVF
jgi:putative protease